MDTTSAVLLATGTFLAGLFLGRRPNLDPAQPPAPIDPKALELARKVLAREGKIGAIKAYREATGAGLRDAKHAVDSLDQQ